MSDYNPAKLDISWYLGESVEEMAKGLLGKYLCTNIDSVIAKGMIVETEAYCGRNDRACHSNNNLRTRRNAIMYATGGHAYVYLCYGIHYLFNVVTNKEDFADAVLIRALEPVDGIEKMLLRRKMAIRQKRLCSGPGALSQALGISLNQYGKKLNGDEIWIETGRIIRPELIAATTRVGVQYAGEDAQKLWRYYLKDNPWVSKI